MLRNDELIRRQSVTWIFILTAAGALAAANRADALDGARSTSGEAAEWLQGDYFLGFSDARAALRRQTGLRFFANYAVDLQSNVAGGMESATQYATLGFFGLESELGTTLNQPALDGWLIHAEGYNAEGKNLANNIGNAITPSTLFTGVVPVGLGAACLQWKDSAWEWKIGRVTPEDGFAASPLWEYFVSLAYDDNPWNLATNNPNFAGAPGALWMTDLTWRPDDTWRFRVGLANTSRPGIADPSERGVDFHFDPLEGTLFMAEAVYRWRARLFEARTPLPGSAKLGGYFDSASFSRINPPPFGPATERGLGGAWLILEQQLIRAGDDPDDTGLTAWALGSWGGPQRLATAPWFTSAGLVHQGLIPGRPDDALGLAGGVTWFSDALPGQSSEGNIELTYRIQLTPWLQFQPDLQIILNPNGTGAIDNAIVAGFQSAITF